MRERDEEERQGVKSQIEWQELSVKSIYCVYFEYFDFIFTLVMEK